MRANKKYDAHFYEEKMDLLNTIKVPLNMHYLTNRLPEPNYEPLDKTENKTEYPKTNEKRGFRSESKHHSKERSIERSLEPREDRDNTQ